MPTEYVTKKIRRTFDTKQYLDNCYTRSTAGVRRLDPEERNKHNERKIRQMKVNRIITVAAITAAVTITPKVIASECSASKSASTSAAGKDLIAVAGGADNFKTLVAAIKAAGLVDTLQGKGPFTVFAPTDEAFAKLPAGTVENLLKPENRDQLAAILKYHVLSGKVMAADVKTMEARTVQGQSVDIIVADAGVTVNGAKVVKTDVLAENGVIHVIDTVILPKS
jgi:uncharacterized surface protein with fasciclin (FAS1) repeats